MRKFIVHTRTLPGYKGNLFVLEVEGEMVAAMEDPSIMWLPKGEFWFRIMKPEALYESKEITQPGAPPKKIMVPPVYHSAHCYWTVHQAQVAAERIVKANLEFEVRKERLESFTDEELKTKYAEIQTIMLP